ncbi:hypothetical protein, partial [Calidithermus terrae]|uniref:hypothetical protein n=1 Tax=Calidithermus terrae TaxID=1408545 RepID=UPI00147575E5
MNNLQLSLELARQRAQQLQDEARHNRLLPPSRARLARLLRRLAEEGGVHVGDAVEERGGEVYGGVEVQV